MNHSRQRCEKNRDELRRVTAVMRVHKMNCSKLVEEKVSLSFDFIILIYCVPYIVIKENVVEDSHVLMVLLPR